MLRLAHPARDGGKGPTVAGAAFDVAERQAGILVDTFANGLSGTADPQGVAAAVAGYRYDGAGTMNSARAMLGNTTIVLFSFICTAAALRATDTPNGSGIGFRVEACGRNHITMKLLSNTDTRISDCAMAEFLPTFGRSRGQSSGSWATPGGDKVDA